MADEFVSLPGTTTEEDAEPYINVFDYSAPAVYGRVADKRANKYNFALGAESPGKDALFQHIVAGTEQEERERVAFKEQQQLTRSKLQLAEEYMARTPPSKRSAEALDYIKNIGNAPAHSQTIFEKKFAEKVVDTSLSDSAYKQFIDASTENESMTTYRMDTAEKGITGQHIALKKLEELEEAWSKSSWGNFIVQHAERFVPFKSWYNLNNAIKEAPKTRWLAGNTVADQIKFYHLLPPKDQYELLGKAADELYAINPPDAIGFLRSLLHYTSNEQVVMNAFNIVGDIGIFVPAGMMTKPIVTSAKLAGSGVAFAKTMANVTKATLNRTTHAPQVLENAGDVSQAAVELAWRDLQGTSPQEGWDALRGKLPSMSNPQELLTGGENTMSREAQSRLVGLLNRNAAAMINSAADVLPIQRLQGKAFETALDQSKVSFLKEYTHLNDAIVNTRWVKDAANADYLAIEIGTKEALPFGSEEAAKLVADELYKLPKYQTVQNGSGWFIRALQPVDETNPLVKDVLALQTKGSTPKGPLNTFMGFARSSADTLSPEAIKAYQTATYGASSLVKLTRSIYKDTVTSLDKGSRTRLQTYLERQRDKANPLTPEQRGHFNNTVGDFQTEWKKVHGAMPSEKETASYFTYVQMNDMDWTMRNLSIYRDKSRLGWKMYDFGIDGVKFKSPQIEGKLVDDIHYDPLRSAGILVWDQDPTKMAPVSNYKLSTFADKKAIDKLKGEGYKIVQITQYGQDALRKLPWPKGAKGSLNDALPNGPINYIMVKDIKSAPLSFRQIPYRPGGHVEYAEGYFIRQPKLSVSERQKGKIERITYNGDNNIAHFETEAEAMKFSKRYEEARGMMLRNEDVALEGYLKKNLPHSVKEFKEMFTIHSKDGILDANQPIGYSLKGQTYDDKYGLANLYNKQNAVFQYATENPYNMYGEGINLAYAGQRDGMLKSIIELGDETSPIFKLRPAALMDPMGVMDRSLSNLMRGRYLDDLKIKMAMDFKAEFGHLLDDPKGNAFESLVRGTLNPKADRAELAAANNFRRAAVDFLGLKTDFGHKADWLKQSAVNYIYSKAGPDGLKKAENAMEIADTWTLGLVSDPVKFLRSFAFHTKLGLANPVQFFLQGQTFAHIAALEGPINAAKHMASSHLVRAAALNPDQIPTLAKSAAKFGWDEKQFIEMTEALRRTGFWHVGGEVSMIDDFLDPKLIQSKMGQMLDASALFFREGERMVRMAAFSRSYSKWREANLNAKMTDLDITDILSRADLLTVNMSRATNAGWQKGLLSLPTQFFGYQARMMEQLLGKRTTSAEKMRAFATYSTLYGVPVSIGAFTGVWPFHENIRKGLMERGIQFDENILSKALMNGIPAMVTEFATGQEYNMGERYGPGGLTQLKELLRGEKGIFEAVLGVSGSVMKDVAKSLDPFTTALVAPFRTEDNETLPLSSRDFSDALANVSTINQARKMYNAIFLGKYISKNEVTMDTVNGWDGIFAGLTGLEPRSITDMWLKVESLQDLKEHKKAAEKDMVKYWRLGWASKNDADTMKYFKRAKIEGVLGGFTPEEMSQVFRRGSQGYQEQVTKIGMEFAKRSPERMDAWIKELQRKN